MVGRGRLLNDDLRVRRASRVVSRAYDDRPQVGNHPLPPPHNTLVESGGVQCPVDAAHVSEAMMLETMLGRPTLVLVVHAVPNLLLRCRTAESALCELDSFGGQPATSSWGAYCALSLNTGRNCSSKGEQYRRAHWRRKGNGVSDTRGEGCGAVSDHRGG